MEAAAAVFVELGSLSETETAVFRSRLEEAIAARDRKLLAACDERLAQRARALLERLLAAVGDGPDLPRMPVELERPVAPADPAHREAISRFERLHHACELCGALPDAELSQ